MSEHVCSEFILSFLAIAFSSPWTWAIFITLMCRTGPIDTDHHCQPSLIIHHEQSNVRHSGFQVFIVNGCGSPFISFSMDIASILSICQRCSLFIIVIAGDHQVNEWWRLVLKFNQWSIPASTVIAASVGHHMPQPWLLNMINVQPTM